MTITANTTTANTTTRTNLWRPTAAAAVVAAAASTAVAAVAHAAGVSLEIEGEAIPLMGFFQLVLIFTFVGFLIACGVRRWAAKPRQTFVRTCVALTTVSFVPDLLVSAATSTRFTLMATHLVAAAIVIPVVAARLSNKRA